MMMMMMMTMMTIMMITNEVLSKGGQQCELKGQVSGFPPVAKFCQPINDCQQRHNMTIAPMEHYD